MSKLKKPKTAPQGMGVAQQQRSNFSSSRSSCTRINVVNASAVKAEGSTCWKLEKPCGSLSIPVARLGLSPATTGCRLACELKKVVRLRKEDRSFDEIARELNISRATVQRRFLAATGLEKAPRLQAHSVIGRVALRRRLCDFGRQEL
jgi:hypothetical protein